MTNKTATAGDVCASFVKISLQALQDLYDNAGNGGHTPHRSVVVLILQGLCDRAFRPESPVPFPSANEIARHIRSTPALVRSLLGSPDAWCQPEHRAAWDRYWSELNEAKKAKRDKGGLGHDAIVQRAKNYLLWMGCVDVAAEPRLPWLASCPDAIGWTRSGSCVVIEVKTSRADFMRDFKKPSYRSGRVIGDYRFYMVPYGMVSDADLPSSAGVIEYDETSELCTRPAMRVRHSDAAASDAEELRSFIRGKVRA